MLVLKTLSLGSLHGYGIAKHLEAASHDALRIEEGSLYPSLQRLLQEGWIKAHWDKTPNNQRARYYTITPSGRKQLGVEESSFAQVLAAINLVMRQS